MAACVFLSSQNIITFLYVADNTYSIVENVFKGEIITWPNGRQIRAGN